MFFGSKQPCVTSSRDHVVRTMLTIAALLVIGGTLWSIFIFGVPHQAKAANSTTSISPLLFGTNFILSGNNDQILTAPIPTLLQKMHIKIVRIPMSPSLSQTTYIKAANQAKSIGAIALVILETPEHHSTALSDDQQTIASMNKVFGKGVVYYEYGNEPDLDKGGDPTWYINSWNKNIPMLQKLMNNGRLVGPSSYYADYNYVGSFLSMAKPLPTYISWHEYTCNASWPASVCLSHIDNWTTHISQMRSIMNATIHTSLPIIISEWNYTWAYDVSGDGKHDNTSFMTSWTTKALQVLAANHIYASMQFAAANTQVPLIDPQNHITTQGSVFMQMGG